MGFLSGSVGGVRLAAGGKRGFGQSDVDKLAEFAAGPPIGADGVEVGWAAGRHVADRRFALEPNVLGDCLLWDLVVGTDRPPAELIKSYYETELAALSAANPSGLPSAKQKREAREAARDRIEVEARDGRFRRRRSVPVVWDGSTGEVWLGTASAKVVDRFAALFLTTFGEPAEWLGAGARAIRLGYDPASAVALSAFVPGVTPSDPAWVPHADGRDWLGNEYLLWLWYQSEAGTDVLKLKDGSEAVFMLSRSLALDCPRGQTGRTAVSAEMPCRLAEARRAAQGGKLPRRVGLTVVRHEQQYQFGLSAETLAVSGGRLPPPDDDSLDATGRRFARLEACRHLWETADLAYDAFLACRLGRGWPADLDGITKWLARPERGSA